MKYNTLSNGVGKIFAAFTAFTLALMAIISMSVSCWATTAETPLTLTQSATSYDFEVTESIEMVAEANSDELDIDSFTITNNSNVGKISYDLEAEGANGYTIVADSSDFNSMSVTAKKFSLVANDDHDLTSKYEKVADVDSCEGEDIVALTGHISPTADDVSEGTNIGKITATISWL